MRYLGGKAQIAKELAAVINRYRTRLYWDAFCGSLAVSVALGGVGMSTDVHPALMSLYEALLAGWDPPKTLSKAEWEAAKQLPTSDPLHGFAGFGCSFRGLYFSGYGGGYVGPTSRPGAEAAAKVLVRDLTALKSRGCQIFRYDFFDVDPEPGWLVYCDPPYRGTAGYRGTEPFDHDRFYGRVEEWARFGPVLVSEYELPIGRVVWEKSRARKVGGSGRALERLFLVGG